MTLSRIHQGLKNVTGGEGGACKVCRSGGSLGAGPGNRPGDKALEIPANPIDFLSKFETFRNNVIFSYVFVVSELFTP